MLFRCIALCADLHRRRPDTVHPSSSSRAPKPTSALLRLSFLESDRLRNRALARVAFRQRCGWSASIASFPPISMSAPMTNGSMVRTTDPADPSGSSDLGGHAQPLSASGVVDLRPTSVPRLDEPYDPDGGGFKMSPRSRIRPRILVFASHTRCFRTHSPQCGFAPVVSPSFPG